LSARSALAQATFLLLDYTNTWRFHTNYVDPGFSPGDAWASPDFDDSQWRSGQGLFGYESTAGEYDLFAPFNTYISPPYRGIFFGQPPFPAPPPPPPGPISTYFRTHFNWDTPALNVVLNFTNAVDDGIIVYLNGVELYSFNVPAERPLPWNLLSLPGGANPLGEAVPVITNLLAPSLVMGDNVLAVGLYQHAPTTSDDVFGMRLTATFPQPPLNLDPTEPSDHVAYLFRLITLRAVANASPPPTYQWYEDGAILPGATTPSYSFMNTNVCGGSQTHSFYCVVSNPLGSFQTRTAFVDFRGDDVRLVIMNIVGSPNFSNVVVQFSHFMDRGSAADPFNYAIRATNGDLFVPLSANLLPDGRSVLLNLTNGLLPGTSYELIPNPFITDVCGDGLSIEPRPGPFTTWTLNPCPGVTFEAYFTPPGSPINVAPPLPGQEPWRVLFPDHPSEVFRLVRGFNSLEAYEQNQHTLYGGRMRGLFIPPVSGGWHLFLRSDGPGELWFNPTGPGADGRVLVATENGCCRPFQEPPFPQTSPRLDLVAGHAYYVEADWSVGTWGGYCQVAARLEGDSTIAANLLPIPNEWLGSATLPGVAGSLSLTRQPAGVSVGAGETATLSVGVNTDVPVCYQWLRGGMEIPGAIRPEYSYTAAPAELPIRFNVRVTLLGAAPVMSDAAWVTGSGIRLVRLAAGEARLDWPDASYHLQSAAELNGPWTTDSAATSGTHIRIDAGNRYFRLAK
jgi:hypothetical protein